MSNELAKKKSTRANIRWRFDDEDTLTIRLHDSSWYFILHGPQGSDRQKNFVIKNNIRYMKISIGPPYITIL